VQTRPAAAESRRWAEPAREQPASGAQPPAPPAGRSSAKDILRILESRGLSATRGECELIESCDDLGQLDTWFGRALTATTLSMVFED
jgi:hypothetical protein